MKKTLKLIALLLLLSGTLSTKTFAGGGEPPPLCPPGHICR